MTSVGVPVNRRADRKGIAMSDRKTLGLVLVTPFADWEYGFLAGSAREWFGLDIVTLSPGGGAVSSIGGLNVAIDRPIADPRNDELAAIAAIGSDSWATTDPEGLSRLLQTIHAGGGVVAGICGATLALARAGLFDGRAHTSNGVDWIDARLGSYRGKERYRDTPHAVADDRVVSAPGTAPGTFACAVLEAMLPDRAEVVAQMRMLFAREYAADPS